MRECTVFVINKRTGDLVDEFVTDYENVWKIFSESAFWNCLKFSENLM